ncbi:hypothetical protein ACFQY9_09030 [Microvirga aerilata]|uniref:hypothetical protein n=1 Tax=Microvirga aerilata TaxID=670292 RepID=UPI00363D7895
MRIRPHSFGERADLVQELGRGHGIRFVQGTLDDPSNRIELLQIGSRQKIDVPAGKVLPVLFWHRFVCLYDILESVCREIAIEQYTPGPSIFRLHALDLRGRGIEVACVDVPPGMLERNALAAEADCPSPRHYPSKKIDLFEP